MRVEREPPRIAGGAALAMGVTMSLLCVEIASSHDVTVRAIDCDGRELWSKMATDPQPRPADAKPFAFYSELSFVGFAASGPLFQSKLIPAYTRRVMLLSDTDDKARAVQFTVLRWLGPSERGRIAADGLPRLDRIWGADLAAAVRRARTEE